MAVRMQATAIAPPDSYQESKVAVSLDVWAAKSGHASLRVMGATFEHPVRLAEAGIDSA